MYRIRDVELNLKWYQRIFGVGSITVISSDPISPKFTIVNVKDPRTVKELIYELSETAKKNKRMISADISQDEFVDQLETGGD